MLYLCKGLAESILLGHHNKSLRLDSEAMWPFLESPRGQWETKERAQGSSSQGHTSSCTEAKDAESTSPAPMHPYTLLSHYLLAPSMDLTHKLEISNSESTILITQITSLPRSPSHRSSLPILGPSLAFPIPQPQRPSQKWFINLFCPHCCHLS